MDHTPSRSEQLAYLGAGLGCEYLPGDVRQWPRSFILDRWRVSSLAVRSTTTGWQGNMRSTKTAMGRDGRAWWRQGADHSATLANATAGHGFEMDDAHARALARPGWVIAPMIFATGEDVGAAGDRSIAPLAKRGLTRISKSQVSGLVGSSPRSFVTRLHHRRRWAAPAWLTTRR